MSSSDEPGVAGEYEQVLIRTVRDPDGNEFSVQAAPAFGMAGPIFIGHDSEPSTGGPVLRLVNRLLNRVQQPQPTQSVMVTVIRLSGDEEEVALVDEAASMADARRKVSSTVEEIEAGTFLK